MIANNLRRGMIVRGSDLQSNALDMQSTESVLLHGMTDADQCQRTRLKNALISPLLPLTNRFEMTDFPSPYSLSANIEIRFV